MNYVVKFVGGALGTLLVMGMFTLGYEAVELYGAVAVAYVAVPCIAGLCYALFDEG